MKKYDKIDLSEEEIDTLKAVIDDFENEDQSVRENQIRSWKRLELLWYGFTNIYWDAVAHDWRIYGFNDNYSGDNQGAYYDKSINVFRAYGETVIAALSATVPPIKCLPDDVDNPNDLLTAKSGSKIADLVYNHIDAPLLWVRALFTYYIQGLVSAYNWTDEDEKYGSVDIREEHDELVGGTQSICTTCGTVLMEQETQISDEMAETEKEEYDPGDEDIVLHDLINRGKIPCPQCQMDIDPEIKKDKIVVTRITGVTRQPKSRQRIEILGGLYVRVPNWARTQADCPYISYSYEAHYSTLYEEYPELRDLQKEDPNTSKITDSDGTRLYDRWGRLNPQYGGDYPLNTPTCRNWWLRHSALNSISDEKMMKKLKKKFPDGCHVVLINEEFVVACNENMDDHWTLMINPLSNSLTYDPLGQIETAVQEITNNLVSLELQCIEHSIPQTFFNPKFLNAKQYGQTEVTPGSLYPTKTIGENRNISDGFHTLTTASVSPELQHFGSKINEMGQFVLGATPQIWGGSSGSSSRTASQYAMQRNGAQIRLSALTGRTVNTFWKQIFSKVIPAYMKNMLEDERIVTPKGRDSFEQVVIKRNQLDGKIGDYRLEAPEGLPQSLDQIRETLKEMLQTNNPEILATIGSPENLPFMSQVFGLTGMTIPGESDREKQYEEISLLLNSAPIPGPDGMTEMPSVMPELTVDNHMIEADICRNWLVGEKGRQCKTENPEGYKNILLHLQQHMQMMQQLQNPTQPVNNPQGGQNNQAQPSKKDNIRQLRPVG